MSPGGAGGAGRVRVQAQLIQGLVQAAEPGADGWVAACLLQVPHVLAQQCSHIVDTEVLQGKWGPRFRTKGRPGRAALTQGVSRGEVWQNQLGEVTRGPLWGAFGPVA